jgi:hypothetical protein
MTSTKMHVLVHVLPSRDNEHSTLFPFLKGTSTGSQAIKYIRTSRKQLALMAQFWLSVSGDTMEEGSLCVYVCEAGH